MHSCHRESILAWRAANMNLGCGAACAYAGLTRRPPLPASLNRRAPAGGAVYDLWIVAAAVAGIAAYLLMRRYQEGA